MNLLPSEWLFRMRSTRLLCAEYFLWAFWLYWKLVVPADAFRVLSGTVLVVGPVGYLLGMIMDCSWVKDSSAMASPIMIPLLTFFSCSIYFIFVMNP